MFDFLKLKFYSLSNTGIIKPVFCVNEDGEMFVKSTDMIKKTSFWMAVCFWLSLGLMSLWLMINSLYAILEIDDFHWGMQMVAILSGYVAFSFLGKALFLVREYRQSSQLTIFVKDSIIKIKKKQSINRLDIKRYALTFQEVMDEIPKRLLRRIDLKNLLTELQIWLFAFSLLSYLIGFVIEDFGQFGWIFFFIITLCKIKVSQNIQSLDDLIGQLWINKGFVRNTIIKEKLGFLIIQSVLPNESFEYYTRFDFLLSSGVIGYIRGKRYLIDVLPRKAVLVRRCNNFLVFKPAPYLPKTSNFFSKYMGKLCNELSRSKSRYT